MPGGCANVIKEICLASGALLQSVYQIRDSAFAEKGGCLQDTPVALYRSGKRDDNGTIDRDQVCNGRCELCNLQQKLIPDNIQALCIQKIIDSCTAQPGYADAGIPNCTS